jgi:hypothetical protein
MTNIIKRLFGIKPKPVSLLAMSLCHYNTSTWLECVIANGQIDRYTVKR